VLIASPPLFNAVNIPIDLKLQPFDLESDSVFFYKFQQLMLSVYYGSLKSGAFTELRAPPQLMFVWYV
jgi:hypothetical protein